MNVIEGLHINRYTHRHSIMTLKPYFWKITKRTKDLKALKPGNFARVVDKKGKRINYVFIIHVLKNIKSTQSVKGIPVRKLARAVSIRDNMSDIQRAQIAYIKYLKMKESHELPSNKPYKGCFLLTKDPKFSAHRIQQHNPYRVRNIIKNAVKGLNHHGTYNIKRHKNAFYVECKDSPKTDEGKTRVTVILQRAIEELNIPRQSHFTVQPKTINEHDYYIIAPQVTE